MWRRAIQTSLRYTQDTAPHAQDGLLTTVSSHLVCSSSVVRCSLPVCVRQLPFGVNTLTRDAMAVQVAEGEPVVDIASASAAEEAAPGLEDRVVSSNAYMLVYRRCEWSSSPGSGPVQLPERCLQHVCYSAVKRRSWQQQHDRWADLSELSPCGVQRSRSIAA